MVVQYPNRQFHLRTIIPLLYLFSLALRPPHGPLFIVVRWPCDAGFVMRTYYPPSPVLFHHRTNGSNIISYHSKTLYVHGKG